MSDKPYQLKGLLKARAKDSSVETMAQVDAAADRMGFTVRDPSAPAEQAPVKRGRPAKARTASEARPSFGLDPETHRQFKIWLLQNNTSMQDYLEAHIKSLVKSANL